VPRFQNLDTSSEADLREPLKFRTAISGSLGVREGERLGTNPGNTSRLDRKLVSGSLTVVLYTDETFSGFVRSNRKKFAVPSSVNHRLLLKSRADCIFVTDNARLIMNDMCKNITLHVLSKTLDKKIGIKVHTVALFRKLPFLLLQILEQIFTPPIFMTPGCGSKTMYN
jgi:hypothetical protein